MTHVLRYIELAHSKLDGLLVDLFYNYDHEDNIIVEDLRTYNIINEKVEGRIDLNAVTKLAFTYTLLKLITKKDK